MRIEIRITNSAASNVSRSVSEFSPTQNPIYIRFFASTLDALFSRAHFRITYLFSRPFEKYIVIRIIDLLAKGKIRSVLYSRRLPLAMLDAKISNKELLF